MPKNALSGQPYALGVVTGGQPASDLRAATAFEAGLIGLSAGLVCELARSIGTANAEGGWLSS